MTCPPTCSSAQVAVQVETVQALQVQATCPSSTSFTVTGTDRLNRDAMATSGTWPTHGGCAYLHRTRRGTRNLGGIRRSLPGSLLN